MNLVCDNCGEILRDGDECASCSKCRDIFCLRCAKKIKFCPKDAEPIE